MFKYAEIYGGKVRDLKESLLEFTEFCSIWDPSCFWLDVTGVEDIKVGYVIKSDVERGTYFESPDLDPNYNTLEYKIRAKLEVLNRKFDEIQENAYIISSLGFMADAGNRANRDITGLIKRMEAEGLSTTEFRDYSNVFQIISLEEAKILELEIIKNGFYIYSQKWQYENSIITANSQEELDSINISFEMMDFFNIIYEE